MGKLSNPDVDKWPNNHYRPEKVTSRRDEGYLKGKECVYFYDRDPKAAVSSRKKRN